MRDQETIEQACERIVRQEVLCCVSGVVSTLANGCDAIPYAPKKRGMLEPGNVLAELCEKAFELQSPVLDWEEAATQAGWREGLRWGGHGEPETEWTHESGARWCGSAQDLCDTKGIEPYEWEVFEHWAVSQWLADALIAQGERVDTDFEGLCVWARTTTGQGIAMDSVIRRVVEKLRADYAELTAKRA